MKRIESSEKAVKAIGLVLLALALIACNLPVQLFASTKEPAAGNSTGMVEKATLPSKPAATQKAAVKVNVPSPDKVGDTYISPVDGMEMVAVPAGDFLMGSDNTEADEAPQHEVYLDGFWMDETEVTNAMYEKCVTGGGCTAPYKTSSLLNEAYYGNPKFADSPALWISWDQAMSYCQWAGRKLPTEAEWEKAARGKDGQTYPWGEEAPTGSLANFYEKGLQDVEPVGKNPAGASPYGALDMAGNVWEWVTDWYSETYYASSPAENPQGPESGRLHIIRGGDFNDGSYYIRASVRGQNASVNPWSDFGFRCDLPAK